MRGGPAEALAQHLTAPANVNGRFVVDGVVGDYLCAKYGDLKDMPLLIDVVENRLAGLACDNGELAGGVPALHRDGRQQRPGGRVRHRHQHRRRGRAGQHPAGREDPGRAHRLRPPYAEHTGQTWSSTTHIDCVGRDFDIWIDGEAVMREGKFLC